MTKQQLEEAFQMLVAETISKGNEWALAMARLRIDRIFDGRQDWHCNDLELYWTFDNEQGKMVFMAREHQSE